MSERILWRTNVCHLNKCPQCCPQPPKMNAFADAVVHFVERTVLLRLKKWNPFRSVLELHPRFVATSICRVCKTKQIKTTTTTTHIRNTTTTQKKKTGLASLTSQVALFATDLQVRHLQKREAVLPLQSCYVNAKLRIM